MSKASQIIKILKVLIAWFSEDSQNRILSSHKFAEYSSILDYFSTIEGINLDQNSITYAWSLK